MKRTPDSFGSNVPYWRSLPLSLGFSPLTTHLHADVCVVGGGISGLTTAYLLAEAGRDVVLIEKGQIGSGETSRTTAHISNVLDDHYYRIESRLGSGDARLAAESHTYALSKIREIIETERIECDFRVLSGYLFANDSSGGEELQREYEAASRAGVSVSAVEAGKFPALSFGPSLEFHNQAQFHPLKYLQGLAEAFRRKGGRIFTDTEVSKVSGSDPVEIHTALGHCVYARSVVVATHTPFIDRLYMHTKQSAYRSYVIGIEIPVGEIPFALYWDTEDPYHYMRYAGADEGCGILIVGGEDHKTGQFPEGESPWDRLENWARSLIPGLGSVRYYWSGQIEEPEDYLGYAGRNPGKETNRYIITGDSGNGMTHGTLGAKIISDLILGIPNAWEEVYSPSRITFSAAPDFVRENTNSLFQYRDYFRFRSHHPERLAEGEGGVFRKGVKQVASYRDETGKIHSCSAVCPHLGALLRWNPAEKSWDCPAHGSRFDPSGRVINGPASCGLKKVVGKKLKRGVKINSTPDAISPSSFAE